MSVLKATIKQLYSTFSPYTTEGIQHCNCGCIKEADVVKLFSKPLAKLTIDDLISYQGSAMYTWGEVEHYKHFLPRICELYATKSSGLIHLDEIANKLEYAKWTEWPENEVKAIKDFVHADWIEYANNTKAEISDTELLHYSRFLDAELLVSDWKITQSARALKNFVSFFYYYSNRMLNQRPELDRDGFIPALLNLIHTPGLTEKLQSEYFENEGKDRKYAELVSVVLQMVEQHLKSDQIRSG